VARGAGLLPTAHRYTAAPVGRPSRIRRLLRTLAPALAAVLLVAPAASAGVILPEAGGSANADSIRTLYVLVLVIAIIVFVGVEGLLIWSMLKYRARRGRVAAQIHGNTRLEIGWTVGAGLILVLITTVTFVKLGDIKDPPPSDNDLEGNPVAASAAYASTDQPSPPRGTPALRIRVDGQQYVWRYQYPGREGVFAYEEMVVPTGVTVVLDITADDVVHSWWIPQLGGKMDALPGYTNHSWFKATKPGVYEGQCAELCGRGHANMYAKVRAVPPQEYQAWYAGQARAIEQARQLGSQARRRLEQQMRAAAEGG
jgi:cytochrome c oxidase subunit 2